VILKLALKNEKVRTWAGLNRLRMKFRARTLEHLNERRGSIKTLGIS
jgi:hypothetical protein